jgi:hypothetical protein
LFGAARGKRVMLLALVTGTLMVLGLIVHQRATLLATGTMSGTVVRFEATRAAEFSALLCVLTAPWLIIAAILLNI